MGRSGRNGGQTYSNNQKGHNQHKSRVGYIRGKPYKGDIERLFKCNKCGWEDRTKRIFPWWKGNHLVGWAEIAEEWIPKHNPCGGDMLVVVEDENNVTA